MPFWRSPPRLSGRSRASSRHLNQGVNMSQKRLLLSPVMTMLGRGGLAVIVLSVSAAAVSAQPADKMISQHLKAVGGTGQLRRIESVTYAGAVTNPATGQ